jgi:hypothetical protein
MSWNDYVNDLVATGHIDKAALVGSLFGLNFLFCPTILALFRLGSGRFSRL